MLSYEILSLHDIHKTYADRLILAGISLTVSRGQRIALVGENGAGKSTLARLLIGHEPADAGTIRLAEGAICGYLPQEVTSAEEVTIGQYIARQAGDLDALASALQALELAMSAPDADLDDLLSHYGELQDQYQRRGGYDLAHRREAVFAGLGLGHLAADRLVPTLSGGEKTRLALAGLLLQVPDLLVLDEPTNHLDADGIAWLETTLAGYEQGLILITHDRTFIDRVATHIAELSSVTRTLTIYHGTYADYLAQRTREHEEAVEAYHDRQNEMARLRRTIKLKTHNTAAREFRSDGDKFLRNFKREGGERLVSQAIRDARQRLTTLEADPLTNPRHLWRVRFGFDSQPLASPEPLRFSGLRKTYGERLLFDEATASLGRGERVALIAPNGAGKSTLLRLILGLETADQGEVWRTPGAVFAYLDQDGDEMGLERTVLEAYRDVSQGEDRDLLADLHRNGLFSDATLGQRRIGALSLGQRRKLGLARLVASRANVLILDEPTNHLDLLSLEALEEALRGFGGAFIAATHDRRFIDQVATRCWRLEGQRLIVE